MTEPKRPIDWEGAGIFALMLGMAAIAVGFGVWLAAIGWSR